MPVVARGRPRRLPVPNPAVGAVLRADARARSSGLEYRVYAGLNCPKARLRTVSAALLSVDRDIGAQEGVNLGLVAASRGE